MTPQETVNYLFDGFDFSKVVKSHRDSSPVQLQGSVGRLMRIGGVVTVHAFARVNNGIRNVVCMTEGDESSIDELDDIIAGDGGDKFRSDIIAFDKTASAYLTADFVRSGKSPEEYLSHFGPLVLGVAHSVKYIDLPLDVFVAKLREINDSE